MTAKPGIRTAIYLTVILLSLTSACGAGQSNEPQLALAGSTTGGCEQAARRAEQMASISGPASEKKSTAGEVAEWVKQQQSSSPGAPIRPVPAIERLPDTDVVYFCAYNGSEFVTPRPPGVDEPDTAILFVLPDDEVVLYVVGLRQSIGPLIAGPPTSGAVVPDLTGLTIVEARASLAAAGLRLGKQRTEQSSGNPAGTVLSISPAAGTATTSDARVDLVVAGR